MSSESGWDGMSCLAMVCHPCHGWHPLRRRESTLAEVLSCRWSLHGELRTKLGRYVLAAMAFLPRSGSFQTIPFSLDNKNITWIMLLHPGTPVRSLDQP